MRWLESITDSKDMNLSKLRETVKDMTSQLTNNKSSLKLKKGHEFEQTQGDCEGHDFTTDQQQVLIETQETFLY